MERMPETAGYVGGDVLVTTGWVETHLDDPTVRLVEVSVDTTAYHKCHIPGAVGWRWAEDIREALRRDVSPPSYFEALMSRCGIVNDSTVVLYGDNNNFLAVLVFWLLKIQGHDVVRLLHGGRREWLLEDRPVTTYVPRYKPTDYRARPLKAELRALRELVWTVLD